MAFFDPFRDGRARQKAEGDQTKSDNAEDDDIQVRWVHLVQHRNNPRQKAISREMCRITAIKQSARMRSAEFP